MKLDATHDPRARSWVPTDGTDFPVQSLPLCRFLREGRVALGVGIGALVVDLSEGHRAGLWEAEGSDLGSLDSGRLRHQLFAQLTDPDAPLREHPALLLESSRCDLLVPFEVGDYTDFYASIHHATRVGRKFRPENPLLPNYRWLPIGYHGRASTVVASGARVRRPCGQSGPEPPTFGPSRELDYELEIGLWVGRGNAMGESVPIAAAERHLLGICLLNDWSARDLQRWEYQPLGPFLAKSFATTVSPWVVTREALEPFRCPSAPHEPPPLPHLAGGDSWDVTVEAHLSSAAMRAQGVEPMLVSRANLRDLFWNPSQLLAHHASNGCRLRSGDLLGTGTISGSEPDSGGCLLERGPLELPTGERRLFLEDGDEVLLTGVCRREGYPTIGLGECRGIVDESEAVAV